MKCNFPCLLTHDLLCNEYDSILEHHVMRRIPASCRRLIRSRHEVHTIYSVRIIIAFPDSFPRFKRIHRVVKHDILLNALIYRKCQICISLNVFVL